VTPRSDSHAPTDPTQETASKTDTEAEAGAKAGVGAVAAFGAQIAAPLRASFLPSLDRWPDDVRVWRLNRADDLAWLAMRETLTPTEQARAARFLRPADQARFIATRATLRALLAIECDVPPSTLRFHMGAHGRPSLASDPTLSFNVSHSGTYALIVISAKRTVGIDVESVDAGLDWQSLARRVCTRDEWDAIARLPAARQTRQFFRCWTAKEALLKALGMGIGDALQSVSVDLTRETHAGEQQPTLHSDKARAASLLRFHWIDDIATAAPAGARAADTVDYCACVAFSTAFTDIL